MNVYEQVKKALQDIVAPELRSLQAEIKRLDDKIDTKIESLKTEIKRIDDKIDIAIQIRERLAAIEAELSSIEAG